MANDAVDVAEVWRRAPVNTRCQHAVFWVRLSRWGLSRARVSNWFAVRGGECVEKFAHIQLAHLGCESVKAARDDRQERGRVDRIEGIKSVVRRPDEHGEIERYSEAQQANQEYVSHARPLTCPAPAEGRGRTSVPRLAHAKKAPAHSPGCFV